jgi:hypothetical protein
MEWLGPFQLSHSNGGVNDDIYILVKNFGLTAITHSRETRIQKAYFTHFFDPDPVYFTRFWATKNTQHCDHWKN